MIDLRGLHPEVREVAEMASRAMQYYFNVRPVVTSGYRSWVKQKELRDNFERCVREGRFPGPGCRYPANRPGDSSHNYGLSFDSVVPDQHQGTWDYVRRWYGFRVPQNDRIHAEVPNWRMYVT